MRTGHDPTPLQVMGLSKVAHSQLWESVAAGDYDLYASATGAPSLLVCTKKEKKKSFELWLPVCVGRPILFICNRWRWWPVHLLSARTPPPAFLLLLNPCFCAHPSLPPAAPPGAEPLHSDGESWRSLPIRLHTPDRPFLQEPVSPMAGDGNDGATPKTIGQVVDSMLGSAAGAASSGGTGRAIVVQGVVVDDDTPGTWLAEHMCAPDRFLHVSVRRTAAAAAGADEVVDGASGLSFL